MNMKRIMVGLDLTAMDQSVLTYASYLSELLNVESVYFVHIEPDLKLDEDFMKEYGLDNLTVDEKILEKMKDEVEYNYEYKKAELHYEVHEGSVTEKFLHWIEIKEIDLIVVGRKREMGGSGLIPTRIARRSGASILFVPEGAKQQLNKIVVPVDGSEYSKNALGLALELNKNSGSKAEVICENVYFVPKGYSKTGKTYEEMAEIMAANAKKLYDREFSSIEGDFKDHYSLDDDRSPADKIYLYAMEANADLIVLGGKGRTFSSSVLIGSVAEKLIGYDADIPLLVVKKKGEKWGFWDAFKNL